MNRAKLKNIINKSKEINNLSPYDLFVNSLPAELDYYKDGGKYRLKAAWNAYGKPKNFKEAIWEGLIQPINESTYKMPSIGYNEEKDSYEYLNVGRDNEIVGKDIRVWDNDVIPFVQELKQGGYVRTFNEEENCWTYSKNSQEIFKLGGKIKVQLADGYGSIEIDTPDADLKAGRKPIGKKDGKNLYLNSDGKAVYADPKEGAELTQYMQLGGSVENEEIPANLFELKDGDYYFWPDDENALNFIKNNKKFRKNYKLWGQPRNGEKVRLVNRKKYLQLWYDLNKDAIIKYITNTTGNSDDYSYIVGNGLPARSTGEFTEDGKELYETPDGLLYTMYKHGGQMNVIPEGALHAHKNHMELAEKGEITSKGIPVVDNNGEQLAEIERNELILNKDTSSKIELLYKKFNSDEIGLSEKDEIAIKAGKLLSILIIENTDDRTGLILEVELKI